jgi:hypothetical protein
MARQLVRDYGLVEHPIREVNLNRFMAFCGGLAPNVKDIYFSTHIICLFYRCLVPPHPPFFEWVSRLFHFHFAILMNYLQNFF